MITKTSAVGCFRWLLYTQKLIILPDDSGTCIVMTKLLVASNYSLNPCYTRRANVVCAVRHILRMIMFLFRRIKLYLHVCRVPWQKLTKCSFNLVSPRSKWKMPNRLLSAPTSATAGCPRLKKTIRLSVSYQQSFKERNHYLVMNS